MPKRSLLDHFPAGEPRDIRSMHTMDRRNGPGCDPDHTSQNNLNVCKKNRRSLSAAA